MKKPYLDYQCIRCLITRNLKIDEAEATDEDKTLYVRELLKIITESPKSSSAPDVVEKINKLQKDFNIFTFDCKKIKSYYNRMILEYEAEIQQKINCSTDKLYTAVRYALIGNFIDFGANSNLKDDELKKLIDNVDNVNFDMAEFNSLKNELKQAKKITYLADNCGEIVFDKILIKCIKELYPHIEITVIVRGEDVLNDVTLEDAKEVNLCDIVKVIDNGTAIAGTNLNRISKQCLEAIESADLIISKGMGNFETLIGCKKNIFYLFMCKCMKFCKILEVPLNSYMILNDKRLEIE
ncbi:MAG: DUF89 family protein [Clostridia bacterium]|nr:DUF89 family protein [Clostridia bacterium]